MNDKRCTMHVARPLRLAQCAPLDLCVCVGVCECGLFELIKAD